MMQCSVVECSQNFWGTCCLHLQGNFLPDCKTSHQWSCSLCSLCYEIASRSKSRIVEAELNKVVTLRDMSFSRVENLHCDLLVAILYNHNSLKAFYLDSMEHFGGQHFEENYALHLYSVSKTRYSFRLLPARRIHNCCREQRGFFLESS
jgi:hypothetical protein